MQQKPNKGKPYYKKAFFLQFLYYTGLNMSKKNIYWGKGGRRKTRESHKEHTESNKEEIKLKNSEISPKKDQKETKGKKYETLFSGVVVFICIVILVFMNRHEKQTYPKLVAFGWTEWSAKCQGEGRDYYMLSDVNANEESLGGRHLKFLDEEGTALYYTPLFEKASLDQDGVWRFNYHKKDIRLFAKKDRDKVLKGDEKVFEISENFNSLTVITNKGKKLTLNCQKLE